MVDNAKIVDYDTAKSYRPKGSRPAGAPRMAELVKSPPVRIITAAATDPTAGQLVIRVSDPSDQQMLLKIKDILGAHSGAAETYIVLGEDEPKKIKLPF